VLTRKYSSKDPLVTLLLNFLKKIAAATANLLIVFLALYLLNAEGDGDLDNWFVRILLFESILCAILAYAVDFGCE
jgi:hypothetical protein